MKAQNINKLAKKTVFVYKSVKDQSNYMTDPSVATAGTVMTSMAFDFKK